MNGLLSFSYLPVLLGILLVPSGVTQDDYGPPGVQAVSRPVLFVPTAHHDWGESLQGAPVEHRFRVENRGKAPLKVLRVKTSCGCTAVDYDRENREVHVRPVFIAPVGTSPYFDPPA